ncbi:MAG: hypothetical protein Q8861_15245 [Bacteroidota bacterium]|nr:hypothetical protein [Bacteroidota bacterium]
MNQHFQSEIKDNFFEVKESRTKFMILGSGALLVAVFLLSFTPRIISVVTLIGGLLAFVGLVMIYKVFHIKTLLRIDRDGLLTSKQGMILWSQINDYSFENISKSAVLTLQCQPPYETVLIDLSMSTVKNLKQVTDAIAYFSDNLLPKNKTEQ